MTINLNDRVLVRLTDAGKKALVDYYAKLVVAIPKEYKSVEEWAFSTPGYKTDGTLETQLWDLMNMFGAKTFIGNPSVFEGNSIEIIHLALV